MFFSVFVFMTFDPGTQQRKNTRDMIYGEINSFVVDLLLFVE